LHAKTQDITCTGLFFAQVGLIVSVGGASDLDMPTSARIPPTAPGSRGARETHPTLLGRGSPQPPMPKCGLENGIIGVIDVDVRQFLTPLNDLLNRKRLEQIVLGLGPVTGRLRIAVGAVLVAVAVAAVATVAVVGAASVVLVVLKIAGLVATVVTIDTIVLIVRRGARAGGVLDVPPGGLAWVEIICGDFFFRGFFLS
jgi:hypothetical protein